jgi:hypothetical protein
MRPSVVRELPALLRSLPNWFSQPVREEESDPLAALPLGVMNELVEQLNTLSPPKPYQQAVQQAAREAIQAWQANPATASNSLVVLSRPVEAIAPILSTSLDNYLLDCDVRFCLAGYHRSPDPLTITEHIRRELEPEQAQGVDEPAAPVTQADIHENIPTVMVIPSIESCFLRCIQGWDGIEYFQTLATHDTSRFWIFGCNHWAWAFLDKVCQVSAYLEDVVPLPELTADELELWLRPLTTSTIAQPDDGDFDLVVELEREHPWETLADLAKGTGATAAHIWLQSLRMQPEDLTTDGALPDDITRARVMATQLTLPKLMTLEVIDRYLLHSLLMHGEMTRSHLAISLGEAERNIRARVQVLRRSGIILQRGRRLRVHPAYYPTLYRELGDNNFLIGQA